MKNPKKTNHLIMSYLQGVHDYINGRFRPLFGHLWITRKCNLSCSYCYVKDNSKPHMSLQTVEKSMDAFWRLGVRIVGLMGGEPTLHPDLTEIINMLSSRGFIVYLSTNSSAMTKESVEEIKYSGIDVIDVSLDSVNSCNASRKTIIDNNGIWEYLIESNKNDDYILKVNSVLTTHNYIDILSIVKYCISRDIMISIGIESNPLAPEKCSFREKSGRENLLPIQKAVEELIHLKLSHPEILVDPLAYYLGFKNRLNTNMFTQWNCAVGKGIVQIDWDGCLFYCSKLMERSGLINVNNVTQENFTKMMRSFRKKSLPRCNALCYSNCAFNVSYFRRNPIELLPRLNNTAKC